MLRALKRTKLWEIRPIYVLVMWGSHIQIGCQIAHRFGRLVRSRHWTGIIGSLIAELRAVQVDN